MIEALQNLITRIQSANNGFELQKLSLEYQVLLDIDNRTKHSYSNFQSDSK